MPQLQTPRKKRWWMSQKTMAMRRCRNRPNDLIHGSRRRRRRRRSDDDDDDDDDELKT
jgi:hypothetical protein